MIIHEAMRRPEQWAEFYAQPPQLAWRACCELYTFPQSFSKNEHNARTSILLE